MARLLGWISLAASLSLASGCAMCCHPYDCHYLYQGGRWVRDIPDSGRVGSAFAEAGHRVDDGMPITAGSAPQANQLPAPPNQPNPSLEPFLEQEAEPGLRPNLNSNPNPNLNPNSSSRLVPSRSNGGTMGPYLPTENTR